LEAPGVPGALLKASWEAPGDLLGVSSWRASGGLVWEASWGTLWGSSWGFVLGKLSGALIAPYLTFGLKTSFICFWSPFVSS